MKFSLSNTMKFIASIPLISSCCFAGLVGTKLETNDSLKHFTLCLEFKSHVAYRLSRKECAEWIKQERHKNSIYNVISTAIADCILEKHEFADKNLKDNIIVVFKNTVPKNYTQANWNAVVLYNFIKYVFANQEQLNNLNAQQMMQYFEQVYVSNWLLKEYGKEFADSINKAFKDIKEYNQQLDIMGYLRRKTDDIEGQYADILYCKNYKENGLARITILSKKLYTPFTYNSDGVLQTGANLNIYVEKGLVDRVTTYEDDGKYSFDLDEFMNIKSKGTKEQYNLPKKNKEIDAKVQKYLQSNDNSEPFENTTYIDRDTKRILDIIDVGFYITESDAMYLEWLAVDEAYLDKAYYKYALLKRTETLSFNAYKGLYLGHKSLSYITIPDSKLSIIINADYCNGCATLTPYTEELMTHSDSVTKLILEANVPNEIKKINKIITKNKNLKEINLKLNIDSEKETKLSKIADLIYKNQALEEVELKLEGTYNLQNIDGLLTNNKNLKYATISMDFDKEKLETPVMFNECKCLQEVEYKGTGCFETISKLHNADDLAAYEVSTTADKAPQLYAGIDEKKLKTINVKITYQ